MWNPNHTEEWNSVARNTTLWPLGGMGIEPASLGRRASTEPTLSALWRIHMWRWSIESLLSLSAPSQFSLKIKKFFINCYSEERVKHSCHKWVKSAIVSMTYTLLLWCCKVSGAEGALKVAFHSNHWDSSLVLYPELMVFNPLEARGVVYSPKNVCNFPYLRLLRVSLSAVSPRTPILQASQVVIPASWMQFSGPPVFAIQSPLYLKKKVIEEKLLIT